MLSRELGFSGSEGCSLFLAAIYYIFMLSFLARFSGHSSPLTFYPPNSLVDLDRLRENDPVNIMADLRV